MRVLDAIVPREFPDIWRQSFLGREGKAIFQDGHDVPVRRYRVSDLAPEPVLVLLTAIQTSRRKNQYEIRRVLDFKQNAIIKVAGAQIVYVEKHPPSPRS